MFAVLLPGRRAQDAQVIVQELSKVVMHQPFEVSGRTIDVEVSFGWAESGTRVATVEELLGSAKRVLNEARRVRITGALE
jgi:GGDEF domain-containing protein